MKALLLTKNQTIECQEVPLSGEPAPGMIRVKMHYITLNHLDLFSYRGMAFAKRQFPIIVGAEGAGQVIAVNTPQDNVWLGKRVVVYTNTFCGRCRHCLEHHENLCLNNAGTLGFHCDGLAREYVDIPASMLIEVPEGVELIDAACAPVTHSTVHYMLMNNAQLQAGESVLIHAGGSGIGSLAIRMAKFFGAEVYTTVGSNEKAEKAKALGADHVINYQQQRFSQVIRQKTHRQGVDVVFEHVGQETWEQSIISLAIGGRLVTCGSTTGVEGMTNLYTLFNRQLKIFGSFGAPKSSVVASLDMMAKRQVLPVLDCLYGVADYTTGLDRLRQRQVFGKIVLKLWE